MYLFTLLRALCILSVAAVLFSPIKAHAVDPSEWTFLDDAVLQGDVVVLTPPAYHRSGTILHTNSLCAQEYKISFELNVGSITSDSGGSGIALFVQDQSGEVQWEVHADTFLQPELDQRYELDGNHVSIYSSYAYFDETGTQPTSGNFVFGPAAAARMPFTMEGSGWFVGQIHRKSDEVVATFSNGTAGLELKTWVPQTAGATVFPGIRGETGDALNQHMVRNISIEIIDNSACPDYQAPYTTDEARAELALVCGDVAACPDELVFLDCVETTLQSWSEDDLISGDVSDFLMLEMRYGMSFCQGYQECQQEIDPEAIEAAAFEAGHTQGYEEGYSAGTADGIQTGYADGHTTGHAEGYASGQADGYQAGEAAGRAAGYAEGYAAGEAAGYAAGQEAGYSTGYAEGEAAGYTTGHDEGYSAGYLEGHTVGFSEGEVSGFAAGELAGYETGYATGFEEGDAAGYTRGHAEGYGEGFAAGEITGYAAGKDDGYTLGAADGRELGFQEGHAAGFAEGEALGYSTGYQEGETAGYGAGYEVGYTDGNSAGLEEGHASGLAEGYAAGVDDGRVEGHETGYAAGTTDGYDTGYTEGYELGFDDGLASAPTCSSYLTMEEARAELAKSCDCSRMWSRGHYVVCGLLKLRRMRHEDVISEDMKRDLMKEIARNRCK